MTAGSIRRRCRCRDENGKDFGSKCPKLAQRNHGAWQLRHELPPAKDGKRQTFRRDGYAVKSAAPDVRDTQPGAQDDLDRVRELLNVGLAEGEQQAVAELLLSLDPKELLPSTEEVRRKLRAGQALGDNMTAGEWLEKWHAQETHRKATEISYESHIRLYLKPKIGDVRLDRLTVGQLVEMFASIDDDNDAILANNTDRRALLQRIKEARKGAEKQALREQLAGLAPFRRPVGPSSKQRIRATLRAAINDAMAQQLCTFNAAHYVEIESKTPKPIIWTSERVAEWRRTGERPGPVLVWTPAQAGAFLDFVADEDPDYEAMWHLMVFRGPRRGEVAGLPWTETNLGERTIQISTQLTEVAWEVTEGSPKSEAGERTIPLDEESVRLLRAHRARQAREKLRLGPAWQESGRVFTKPDGSPLRPSWIGDQFARLYTTAGLPPIRLHDLRHTAATLMLAAKVDMKIVQETLGHSALATTSDIYSSVLPEVALAAAEATAAMVPRGTRRAPTNTSGHPPGTQEQIGSTEVMMMNSQKIQNRS
jgi:integrase